MFMGLYMKEKNFHSKDHIPRQGEGKGSGWRPRASASFMCNSYFLKTNTK